MKKIVYILLVVLFVGGTANALLVTSFSEIMALDDTMTVQSLSMVDGDNIMVQQLDGTFSSVVDAGYGDGFFHLGLLNADGFIIGWAKNSVKQYAGYEGCLAGQYSSVLGAHNRPTNAVLVYDALNDGWHVEGGIVGTVADVLAGDRFWWTDELLFNGILGDVSQFPPYGTLGANFPSIAIAIPEPVTLVFLSIGSLALFRHRRA